jgi:uncharacterized protein YjiS (DUF1127 family)
MMHAIASLIDTAVPRTQVHLPLAAWLRAARERRALSRLTGRELADMGIDPAAARREAARPFWDLPHGR